MSHELTQREDGRFEFAYLESEGPGWHGHGQAVKDDASIEEWQREAGMDWKVQRSKIRYATAPGADFLEYPDQHVLFRSDTKAALSVVSNKYNILQPKQNLEFFRDLVGVGGFKLSAAGTIFGGKRFWATAKIGEAAPVSVKDKIGCYLLVSTSVDGSRRTDVLVTTIRAVCKNTVEAALGGAEDRISISHRSVFDPKAIKIRMGLQDQLWAKFRNNMTRLANVALTDDDAKDIVASMFMNPAVEEASKAIAKAKGEEKKDPAGYTKIMELFRGGAKGSDLDGVRGTAYGLLQATTEYADHHVRASSADNRFASAQWGVGRDLKVGMAQKLLALV